MSRLILGSGVLISVFVCCCCWGMGTDLGDWMAGRRAGLPAIEERRPVAKDLDETRARIGKGADLSDMPRFPRAEPGSEEIEIPGTLAALIGELGGRGAELRVYHTNATADEVLDWYRLRMRHAGWEQQSSPFDTDSLNLLVFKKSGATGIICLLSEARGEQRTQIVLIRAASARGD